MFSLIITIISIALVAALALATIYYGGAAFSEGGDAARAAQLINEGQQLQGANTLRRVQTPGTDNVATITTLVPQFLAQQPTGWDVVTEGFSVDSGNAKVCEEVGKKANIADADAATAGYQGPATLPAGNVFGCLADGSVVYRF